GRRGPVARGLPDRPPRRPLLHSQTTRSPLGRVLAHPAPAYRPGPALARAGLADTVTPSPWPIRPPGASPTRPPPPRTPATAPPKRWPGTGRTPACLLTGPLAGPRRGAARRGAHPGPPGGGAPARCRTPDRCGRGPRPPGSTPAGWTWSGGRLCAASTRSTPSACSSWIAPPALTRGRRVAGDRRPPRLRPARPVAEDVHRPWERAARPGRSSPARVRRGFRRPRARPACPAGAPEPFRPGPGGLP